MIYATRYISDLLLKPAMDVIVLLYMNQRYLSNFQVDLQTVEGLLTETGNFPDFIAISASLANLGIVLAT